MGALQSLLEAARLLLLEAARDPDAWPAALSAFAEACGGYSGQLIARDGGDRLLFHLLTNVDPELTAVGEAAGLGDLARNPRLQIGHRAQLMKPYADQDFVNADRRRRYDIYPDYFERYDLAFNSQVVLHRGDDLLLRASISRSNAQGPMDSTDLNAFAALAPYVQAAARQQLTAERRAVEGLLHAAEAAELPLWVLNRHGRLIAASRAAENLIAEGTPFRVERGRLRFAPGAGAERLRAVIDQGLGAWSGGLFPAAQMVTIGGGRGAMTLKVTTLAPTAFSLAGEPAVLISGATPHRAGDLKGAFELSAAEAHIAELLARGHSPAEVAKVRGVALDTVRTQIRGVFRKVGVRRLSELVARLKA